MKLRIAVPGLIALLVLGLLDLGSTLWWHSRGMMTEFNPLMRPLLEANEWLFSGVKLLTLTVLSVAILVHSRKNLVFCKRVCAVGALAYLFIWTGGVAVASVA